MRLGLILMLVLAVSGIAGADEADRKLIQELKAKLAEQDKLLRAYQNKLIRLEIDYADAMDRTRQLANELATVRGEPPAKNPPGESVKGLIKAIDKPSGFVTIDIGSDNGLVKGHTLEVYRLGTKPTHVATLRILEIRPHEAVGRAIARTGEIQAGDKVADQFPPKE